MFGGNDDLSFVDDDFLQEVFHSSGTNAVRTKGNEINLRNNEIIPSLSFPNKSLGNQERQFNGHINISNSHQTVENPSHKQVLIENECEDKAFFDSVFHLDDNFPYDSPELEKDENSPPVTLTTPPDSEFTKFSNSKLCSDLQVNKVSAATGSDIRNISLKQNDFRSKLLQTLKEKKAVHSGSNDCLNVSTTSLNHSEKRPNSDTYGTLNHFIPPVKRHNAQTQSGKEGNHGSTNESIPSTSVQTQHHSDSNNLTRVDTLPSGQEDISGQVCGQSWSSTTPMKSNIPHVRKTVSPGGPLIQKRKFPGPAGILPQPGHNRAPVIPQPDEESPSTVSRTIICSQSSASDYTRGPWQQMISDLELDPSDPASPLKVFNIKWVVRRAGLRGQAGVRKVPFLAVRVHTLDVTHTDATVVLKDPTGEIKGTVASTVMDEFGDALQTGSVLILRGVTVLSPIGLRSMAGSGEHARSHYLNITLNTVLTIYTPDETGHVITTTVGNVDKRELHRQAASPTAATEPRGIVEEEEDDIPREQSSHNKSLFSNMNDSFCNSPGQGSFSFSPQTSVRFPKFTPVAPQHGNVSNFQRVGQQQSQANTSHVRNIRPKQFTPRIPLPAAPVSVPQRKPLHSPQVPLGIRPSHSSTKVSESVPSSGAFFNQAEEKEVKELLSGLDTVSFFDDF